MRRGKQETYRAQVEESMLPGQPVSLLGSCRDEHSPGVGVNMLGQHLLGQESEGNHQSPEQQQRAGPQIHQSIGVPRAGEQEGPGSSKSSSLPVSAPRGTAASLPCWSQLSPSPHGAKPTKAQEQTVQDRSTICRETRQWSGPGHLSSDLGRAGCTMPRHGSGIGQGGPGTQHLLAMMAH